MERSLPARNIWIPFVASLEPYATVRSLVEDGSNPGGVKADAPPASATVSTETIQSILMVVYVLG